MNASRLKLWRLWRRRKELARAHAERRSQLDQDPDMHAPLVALVSAEHTLADASKFSQFSQPEPSHLAPFSEIQARLVGCLHSVDITSDGMAGQTA